MKRVLLFLLAILACGFVTAPLLAQNNESSTLTVYDGTELSNYVPAYLFYFDDFTRSQFVIPEADLADMAGGVISSIKFYTSNSNIPYTTTSHVDVYMKTVNYTVIEDFETKESSTVVYSGFLTVNVDEGGYNGEMTIVFSTPFEYVGGNLLVGIENTTDLDYANIYFYGQTVNGASVSGSSGGSLYAVSPNPRNFIPKTTFTYTGGLGCKVPTGIAISGITSSTATVSWTNNASASSFSIEYMSDTVADWENALLRNSQTNSVELDNLYPETSYKVRVRANCGAEGDTSLWSPVHLFTTQPTCATPGQILATNLTPTSVVLTWTPESGETQWEVEYDTANFTPGTGMVAQIVNTPNFPIQDLESNKGYDFYVRAICSSVDTSEWSDRFHFVTPCATVALPIEENFDSYENWYVPECWRKFENGNSGSVTSYGAFVYNEQPYSGTKALKFRASTSQSGYALLRLPDLDANDISELQMMFMVKKFSGTRPLIVGITPDYNSIDSIFVLATFSDLTNQYVKKTVSFEAYPGTEGYVVIGLPGGHSNSGIYYVDDMIIEVRPSCMYPTDVHAVPYGDSSVALSWTGLETAVSCNIEYGPTGYTLGEGTLHTVTDTTACIISGLAASTAYDFYLQSSCSDTISEWVGPFTVVTSQYTMAVSSNETITTCNADIYDDGGPTGNYSAEYTSTLVIYPATEGAMMMLTGTVNIEENFDFLYVYDGVGTNSDALLATYTGAKDVSVISTTGPLTIQFTSDFLGVYSGFELHTSCVTCFPPNDITVTNITMDSATISWNGSANGYAVSVSGPNTTYATVSDSTITISGLQASSFYNVRVRSFCDEDTSLWSSPVMFSTACGPVEVTSATPWTEGFENYSGTNPMPLVCWQTPMTANHGNGTFPAVWRNWAAACHSGSASLEMEASAGQVIMAVLPEFINDIQDLRLSFWATSTNVNYGFLEIGVLTDLDSVNSFVVLDTANAAGPRNYFSNVSGNGNFIGPFDFNTIGVTEGRIALRYHGATDNIGAVAWNLDDIVVQLIPNCPSPIKSSVHAPYIDGHSATITFVDNNPDHDAWIVYYKKTSDPDTQWMQWPTNATTVTISGLASATSYEVYVVTVCEVSDEVPDATDIMYFTTPETCLAPANVTVNAAATEAFVTWEGSADSYTVVCGEFTDTVIGNSVTVTGLSASSSYTVSIVANCGEDGTSVAATVSFRTACDVISQFPYIEQFDNTDLGCWINQNIIGNNPWHTYTANSVSSPRSVFFDWTEHTSSNLISPIFDLSGMTNPHLSFYHRQTAWEDYVDTLVVSYRTSASSEWVRLAGFSTATYDFQLDSLALPEPSDSYQLCFTGYGNDGYGIYLDDIKVYNVQPAGPVDASVVTNAALNVTSSTATLKGTINNPDEEEILATGFQWKAANDDVYVLVDATVAGNVMTHDLSGLTPGTSYTYNAFIVKVGNDTVFGNMKTFVTTSVSPTQPTVITEEEENVTTESATLKGTIINPSNVTIDGQGFLWKAVIGGTNAYVPATVTDNEMSAELTGLAPETVYRFRAFIVMGNDTVFSENQKFLETLEGVVEPCATPTGLTSSNITKESITVSWDNAEVDSWTVQYRPQGGVFTSSNTESHSYIITGLTPLTTYEIQVQANCGDDNVSTWASITETTLADGVNSYLENNVNLYPNPAKEVVNVQCTMNNVQWVGASIEVLDIYGKLLQTLKADSEITQINVSNLANGMYFVRMTTEQGVVTKRFVKK